MEEQSEKKSAGGRISDNRSDGDGGSGSGSRRGRRTKRSN